MDDGDMTTLLSGLLDAHVQYELHQWRGDALAARVDSNVAALFTWFAEVALEDVCTPSQVEAVVERYAIQFRIGGGLTELWGEFSRLVHASPTSAVVRVDEILPDDLYDDFADKVASMDGVRRELSSWLAQNAALEILGMRLLLGDLFSLVAPEHGTSALVSRYRRRSKLGKTWRGALERLADSMIERLRSTGHSHRARTLERSLDVTSIRSVLDELWATISARRLADVFSAIAEQDLEDFVVLGYEFWLRFRRSGYFRQIARELVRHFFSRYGQSSVAVLLDDLGVTEQMIALEINTFVLPLIERAQNSGQLERQLRQRLQRFYQSQDALAFVQARLHGQLASI